MPVPPVIKRTIAFLDGQNLYHASKKAFGSRYPDYDPQALARTVCALKGWDLRGVRFYTGVPDPTDNPVWNEWHFRGLNLARRRTPILGPPGVPVGARTDLVSCLKPGLPGLP